MHANEYNLNDHVTIADGFYTEFEYFAVHMPWLSAGSLPYNIKLLEGTAVVLLCR